MSHRIDRTMSFAPIVLITVAACAPVRGQAIVFSDNFDTAGSAANWNTVSHAGDYTAEFAFDYSTRGIPSAPNSASGSTKGLRLTVNNNDTIPGMDAVSLFPNELNLPRDRVLKFDMWLNYNGGPGGGSGSTEFATFGIHHAGGQVIWPYNPSADGFWFATSGEGGATDDYCVYRNTTLLSTTAGGYAAANRNHTASFYQWLFPSPTYETQGAPGKHWVEVEIRSHEGVIEWQLNGELIALRLDSSLAGGKPMIGYMDTYPSLANPAADNFVIYDNIRIVAPDCNANATPDDTELAAGTDCNANSRLDTCETIDNGDFDADGDIDADDFAALSIGLAGPNAPPNAGEPTCAPTLLAAFDYDADAGIDMHDYACLQMADTPGPFAPRLAGAPTGSQFMAEVAALTRTQRENRIVAEVLGGNVPGFLRSFIPITINTTISGTPVAATYYVTPDYVCVGHDCDFARVPMTPLIAQPIADALDCLLPTRKMVDDIHAQASVKLSPSPISPSTVDITLATTFYRHHRIVESQRAGQPLGPLVAGIKKDVVITPQLASNPNKVAIYGWHYTNGTPIQPLYLGHVDWYVDYSHGIRLVCQRMLINGVETTVADVLAHPTLHVLLSDEGPVTNPRY